MSIAGFVYPLPNLSVLITQTQDVNIIPPIAANVLGGNFSIANDLETNTPTFCYIGEANVMNVTYLDYANNPIILVGQPAKYIGPRPTLPPTY